MPGEWSETTIPNQKMEASVEAPMTIQMEEIFKPSQKVNSTFIGIERLIQRANQLYYEFIEQPTSDLFRKLTKFFKGIPQDYRSELGFDQKTLRLQLSASGVSSKKEHGKKERLETHRVHIHRYTLCATSRRA